MNVNKRLMFSTAAAIIFSFVFLFWLEYGFDIKKSELPLVYTENLTIESDISMNQRSITAVLPDDFVHTQTLLFKTTHTKVHVLLDGEEIYCCGCDEDAPAFMKSPGTLWHLVSVPEHSEGKNLSILLTAVYDEYFGNTEVISYGAKGACMLELFIGMLPIVVIDCIVLFAGVICIILHFMMGDARRGSEHSTFLSLGIFSMIITGWSLCQCGFLQVLIPNGRILYFIDFFTFYLFAVPFNLLIYNISTTKLKKGYAWLCTAYLVNMAAAVIIQLTGWKDLFEMIKVTHGIMAINAVYVYVAVSFEIKRRENQIAKLFRVPLFCIVFFGVMELISYYVNDFRKTSVFIPLGTILFITMLVWILMVRYHQRAVEEQKAEYFEKLANTDMLTGAFSRNAYENTLKELEKEKCTGRIDIYTFDINEMKYINDHFGHEKGDESLKICYRCICYAFGQTGKCFRTGGDEFVFISDQGKNLDDARVRFENLLKKEMQGIEYPFSVAVGFASYDPFDEEAFREALRRSDEQMYVDKREMRKRKQEK